MYYQTGTGLHMFMFMFIIRLIHLSYTYLARNKLMHINVVLLYASFKFISSSQLFITCILTKGAYVTLYISHYINLNIEQYIYPSFAYLLVCYVWFHLFIICSNQGNIYLFLKHQIHMYSWHQYYLFIAKAIGHYL